MCGIGYKAKTDKEPEQFNTVRCMQIWEFEIMDKQHDRWNMSVQAWLKYYVLIRLMDKSKPRNAIQVIPILMTLFMSAFWHGFYFGFYAFFFGLGLMNFAWKLVQNTALAHRVLETVPYTIIRVLDWMLNFGCISYFSLAHILLTWDAVTTVFSSCYYIGHIGTISAIIIAIFLPKVKKDGKKTTTESTSATNKKDQ